jgi:hypothetical protein
VVDGCLMRARVQFPRLVETGKIIVRNGPLAKRKQKRIGALFSLVL